VLDTVASPHSRRNYAKALDDLFAFSAGRSLTRALLLEYRASIDHLSASTINVRLSAIRKLVGEARRLGMVGAEEAANLSDVPNIRQKGTRLGNWLTREQAKELLAVPDRTTLKGKRDYVILALLVGCALRRTELASLDVSTIQLRENRWVLADLEGKGRRGPRAGRLLRPGLRSVRSRQALDHGASSGPGKSLLPLMISLCPGCHARVHRTKMVLTELPPLLLQLWREQHPNGQEQTVLNFRARKPVAAAVPLAFSDEELD